jgi:hypothetical protein
MQPADDRLSFGDREAFTSDCGTQGKGARRHPPAPRAMACRGEEWGSSDPQPNSSTAALAIQRHSRFRHHEPIILDKPDTIVGV